MLFRQARFFRQTLSDLAVRHAAGDENVIADFEREAVAGARMHLLLPGSDVPRPELALWCDPDHVHFDFLQRSQEIFNERRRARCDVILHHRPARIVIRLDGATGRIVLVQAHRVLQASATRAHDSVEVAEDLVCLAPQLRRIPVRQTLAHDIGGRAGRIVEEAVRAGRENPAARSHACCEKHVTPVNLRQ